MKKKMKDLTLRELQKLERLECNKHENCLKCPYNWFCICEDNLEQEIEVEEK